MPEIQESSSEANLRYDERTKRIEWDVIRKTKFETEYDPKKDVGLVYQRRSYLPRSYF